MSQIEFVNFIATPNEKHLGVATIKLDNKLILRYKVVRNKDGNGFFPACASYKVSDASGDRYIEAFMLDSNFDIQEIKNLIHSHVGAFFKKTTPIAMEGSVHSQNTSAGTMVADNGFNSSYSEEKLPF